MKSEKNVTAKVVGVGACVADMLYTMEEFPREDTKQRAEQSKMAGGGPTATGLVAAAKLGCSSAYIGALSSDASGVFLKGDFEKYGVGTDLIEVKDGCRSFTSSIWLTKKTASRTCVFDRGNIPPLEMDEKKRLAVAQADVLMIDGNEMDAAEQACLTALSAGTKVLYDCGGLYPGVERLLKLTNIMIPSEEFALGHTGCGTVEEAAEKLYEMYHPEIVVITCGKQGGIYYDGKIRKNYPAFLVDAVDTNGCGDVFHGAFAAGIVKGLSYEDCCVFASAVSAVKCMGFGARESAPNEECVYEFLKSRGMNPEKYRGI